MPAPKLFIRLPDESNFKTGERVEPAQLSYWNADAPGGVSGFAPQRSAEVCVWFHVARESYACTPPFRVRNEISTVRPVIGLFLGSSRITRWGVTSSSA